MEAWHQVVALDPLSALAAILVMAVGSAVQAAVGLGLALIVVPLLAILDPTYVPGPILLAGVAVAAITAHRERDAIDRRGLALSLVGGAAGTVIGALALDALPAAGLPKVFGVLVLLAVLVTSFGPPVRATPTSLSLAGAAAGLMGTMVGIHGPPIALVLQNAEPAVVRAMLGVFFAVACLGSVLALAAVGLFGWPHLVRAVILLPGVGLGLLVAPVIRPHINRARLRWVILGVSALSAITLLVR